MYTLFWDTLYNALFRDYINNVEQQLLWYKCLKSDVCILILLTKGVAKHHITVNVFKFKDLEKYWCWSYRWYIIINQHQISFPVVCLKNILRQLYFWRDVINDVIFLAFNWNIWKNITFQLMVIMWLLISIT